jgi:hypothetical protein
MQISHRHRKANILPCFEELGTKSEPTNHQEESLSIEANEKRRKALPFHYS